MKRTLLPLIIFIIAGLVPTPAAAQSLPANTFNLVRNAVFEVVWEKPADDPTVYDKKLNWDLVPYAIRSDNYYSIGTAFAVSETELVTAFHVINLGFESMVFGQYFIRDSQKNIYEVDRITGGSNEKDYLIFTVKGKTFDVFFEFEQNFKTGDVVFSIGNALGEGIVVRNGLVLGTVPEEDSGRWDLLKSSADGNPGNSGGPLVTSDGKVIAVVSALRENILYSVPAEVILGGSRSELPFRFKSRFGHLILANKLNSIFETTASLPDSYTEVRKAIRGAYSSYYDEQMSALFLEAPEYLTGPNNAFLLNSSLSSVFPGISFVDPNDDQWKLSNLDNKSYTLDDNGRLYHTSVGGFNFYKIKKPLSVSIEKVCSDPRYVMDLILQSIRTDRTLWGSDRYRILSFGDPSSTETYRDAIGRTWLTAYWVIGYEDDVQIMYILPLPNGPVVITTRQNSAFLKDYEWDLQKLCDHIFVAYDANFEEWNNFIALNKYIPDFLADMRFNWKNEEQSFSFDCGPLSIKADSRIYDWSNNSELFLAPSWYKHNDKPELGIRKVILQRDSRGKEYFILYRNIKPEPRIGANALENWNDLVAEKFPFDEKPAISVRDNTGSIGAIVRAKKSNPSVLHSLYLSMENPQDEENLSRRFGALKNGISVDY